MMYVIKVGEWFYNKYSIEGGILSRNVGMATAFAHLDVAKQEIIDAKLNDAKVYQINQTELEIK